MEKGVKSKKSECYRMSTVITLDCESIHRAGYDILEVGKDEEGNPFLVVEGIASGPVFSQDTYEWLEKHLSDEEIELASIKAGHEIMQRVMAKVALKIR